MSLITMPGKSVRRTPLHIEMTPKEGGSGASLAPRGGSLTQVMLMQTATRVLCAFLQGLLS